MTRTVQVCAATVSSRCCGAQRRRHRVRLPANTAKCRGGNGARSRAAVSHAPSTREQTVTNNVHTWRVQSRPRTQQQRRGGGGGALDDKNKNAPCSALSASASGTPPPPLRRNPHVAATPCHPHHPHLRVTNGWTAPGDGPQPSRAREATPVPPSLRLPTSTPTKQPPATRCRRVATFRRRRCAG